VGSAITGWTAALASFKIGGVMSSGPFDPEALMDAVAPLLGLTLTPESRAQTALHLSIAAQQAEKLFSIALDDAEEPAPVFTA
jgi:hypothetical protein